MNEISRRKLLKIVGLGGLSGVLPLAAPAQDAAEASPAPSTPLGPMAMGQPQTPPLTQTYLFFNTEEAAFIEAALDTLIPSDPKLPGALDAGVQNYIDKQLSGAWGAGERLFLGGPWEPTRPGLGYQLPFTPAELFHTAITAINADFAGRGITFRSLSPEMKDAYLHELADGKHDLGGISSQIFFDEFYELTMEGYFSDPVYGGNKDMVVWKMIGFPGAFATYFDTIDQHGITVDRPPMSLSEHNGHVHVHPNIPANMNGI